MAILHDVLGLMHAREGVLFQAATRAQELDKGYRIAVAPEVLSQILMYRSDDFIVQAASKPTKPKP